MPETTVPPGYVGLNIVDTGDPNFATEFGIVKVDQIVNVRPAVIITNGDQIRQDHRVLPIKKKVVGITLINGQNIPVSDPFDHVMVRMSAATK